MSTAVSETAQKLKAALELLGPNGENWVKGKFTEYTPEGVKYCAVGACRAVGMSALKSHAILGSYIEESVFSATYWNDASQRTFADVKAVFEKAIEANL